jgi:hypothetical protein
VTNWGGGLKGTGVPLALRKFRTDHPIRNNASENNGKDKMMLRCPGNILVKPNSLSNCKAMITKTDINRPKKIAPIGVKKLRTRLLPVATL